MGLLLYIVLYMKLTFFSVSQIYRIISFILT